MEFAVTSDFAAFYERHERVMLQLANPEKVLRRAVLDLQQLITARIQQRGQKTDGTQIGTYSTKAFKSFSDKNGRRAFDFEGNATKKQKNKRVRNQDDFKHFDYGYKEFRESLGRQTRFVDLTLTGDMLDRGFIAIPTGVNSFGLGFVNKLEYDKMQYNEKKYGTIIQPTTQEYNDALAQIINDINNVLRGTN